MANVVARALQNVQATNAAAGKDVPKISANPVRKKKPAWQDKIKQTGLDDMTLLSKVTNEQIAQNMKERFDTDIIYTNIGDVLISVNPYKWLDIYGDDILEEYIGRSRIELPPHIYAIAEAAYRGMMMEKFNQCVIISGESGAGKTEAAKKIMHYIAAVSGKREDSNPAAAKRLEHVKHIIIETNPLLEAFGNAKTLRNNNSSRFGKYFEIQFSADGDPDGGVITNYLLEKSRVVFQTKGERNFHVFYQFCRGASAQEKEEYGLYDPESFDFLMKGECTQVDHMDDVEEWNAMRHAMNVIGITAEEQTNILSLVAAILWLGQVEFKEERGDKASIVDMSVLEFAASLLGIPSAFLKTALEIREVETQHGQRAGTTYKVPYNRLQAMAARDALCKSIYSRLFDWLVMRINQALTKDNSAVGLSIGVLDIYGFEVFQKNGFEQFCINYVNEKLQQIFIEFTLKKEQEEYVNEGIKWTPINFFNNKIVCELCESKAPPGIFSVLDDVCKTVSADAKAADQSLANRISACKQNAHFDLRGMHFVVKHYAGPVTYEIEGMVEKNKDTLVKDLFGTMQISSNGFISALYPASENDPKSKKAPTTAGFKIKSQANNLVVALSAAMPHYVRCLKPNDEKQAMYFDIARVNHQIQYLGLLDNIKVRRAGFAYRTTFNKFLDRYYLLSGKTSYAARYIWKGGDTEGCKAILMDNNFGPEEWQIGKTKIFLRHPETLFALEDMRENFWHYMVGRIKTAYRTYRQFRHECSNRIKTAFRVWKAYRIECALMIQRTYRDFKELTPFYDLRHNNEQKIAGRKERNRFSIISVRKFGGDYLNMPKFHILLEAMGPGAQEQVVFSSKCSIVTPGGIFSSSKLGPRFCVITKQALYVIRVWQKGGKKAPKQGGLYEKKLERRIPLQSIESFSMSPFADHYVIVHAPSEFYDVCICCDLKTELISQINQVRNWQCAINFSGPPKYEIVYYKKKKSKGKLSFEQVQQFPPKVVCKENSFFKKDKVLVKPGMPASSTPTKPFKKRGTTIGLSAPAAGSAPPPQQQYYDQGGYGGGYDEGQYEEQYYEEGQGEYYQ